MYSVGTILIGIKTGAAMRITNGNKYIIKYESYFNGNVTYGVEHGNGDITYLYSRDVSYWFDVVTNRQEKILKLID